MVFWMSTPNPEPENSAAVFVTWAEAHYRRTGRWPTAKSGVIADAHGETWLAVAMALRNGLRGLPGGSSLSQLLAERRGPSLAKNRPPLTIEQILAWADAWHARAGQWPILDSGPIPEARGETWAGINRALRYGRRGLPGGSSLGRLLAEHRGVRKAGSLPKLSLNKILAWVDAHRRRTGQWPILEARGETWAAVDAALLARSRGLRVRSSLARLLAQYRGKRYNLELLPLSYKKIMAWAEAHLQRKGKWPNINSGPVPESTWRKIDGALRQGLRGLRGGESLARLLTRKRRVPNPASLPDLTVDRVLAWADAYHQTGRWPTLYSGPIAGAAGETWRRVDWALRHGKRGLPRAGSLARFLAERRKARNRTNLPKLVPERILAWVRAHHQRTGRRPTKTSGPVMEAPLETWLAIDHCLRSGGRGLSGGSSLARFLAEHTVGTTELISEP